MTWVIGSGGALTRGVMIGDTRITLTNARGKTIREFDGVQKIHAVAPNMAIGFAGNIDVGFRMATDLAVVIRNQRILDKAPDDHLISEPSKLILRWARRARYNWSKLPAAARRGGCDLLFLAARPPTPPMGLTPPVTWRLRAHVDFEPERADWWEVVSIGSGSSVAEYAAALERMNADRNQLLQFATPTWDSTGGPLLIMALDLGRRIREAGVSGISNRLVLCSMRWGEVTFATNQGIGFTDEERSEPWPPIARTWDEWQTLRSRHNLGNLLAIG